MYAVIFKAELATLDQQYSDLAAELRQLAFENYNCIDFVATTEGNQEIAVSYWHSELDLQQWKKDPIHIEAQQLGKDKWYKSYSVEVVEIKRRYSSN